jgi:hypothetical protein
MPTVPSPARPTDNGLLVKRTPRNKSLFASFSSEKEDSSFFEKKEAKKLYFFRALQGVRPNTDTVL